MWVTRGRLGKGLPKILGVEKLPILLPSSRLAELIMIEAHLENHDGAPGTLARSRTRAWIHRGRYLARKVASRCVHCRAAAACIQEQRMGALPEERCELGAKPFAAICLDLLGPILVKAMSNKRANMKVWPILFVCQATGAMHMEVMHNYGTDALLLQWSRLVSIRGTPRWFRIKGNI